MVSRKSCIALSRTLTNMMSVSANLWAKEQPPFSVTSLASTDQLITATAAT